MVLAGTEDVISDFKDNGQCYGNSSISIIDGLIMLYTCSYRVWPTAEALLQHLSASLTERYKAGIATISMVYDKEEYVPYAKATRQANRRKYGRGCILSDEQVDAMSIDVQGDLDLGLWLDDKRLRPRLLAFITSHLLSFESPADC